MSEQDKKKDFLDMLQHIDISDIVEFAYDASNDTFVVRLNDGLLIQVMFV